MHRLEPAPRLAGLVAAIVLSVALIAAWVSWQARATAIAGAETLARNLVVTLEQHTARTLEATDLGLRVVESRVKAEGGPRRVDPALTHALLHELAESSPQIRSVLVIDEAGIPLHDSGALPPRASGSVADRDYFITHRERDDAGLLAGKVYRNRVNGLWSMFLTRRLSHADGSFAGVVIAIVDPAYFRGFYEQIDVGAKGSVTLISDAGDVLIRHPWRDELIGTSTASSPLFREHLKKAESGTYENTSVIDGVTRIFAYRKVGGLPIIAVAGIARDEVLATWRRQTWTLAGVALAVLAFTGLLAWLLARALAQHDAARALFQAMFDHSTDSLLVNRLHPDGRYRVEALNGAAARAMGVPAVAAAGGRASRADLPPGEAARIEADLQRCLEAGAPVRFESHRELDGASRTWEVVQVPLRDAGGRIDRVLVSARDITHLKRAEEAARAAERQAVETNARLLLAEQIAQIGHWRIELPSNRLAWSEGVYRIHGLDPATAAPALEAAISAYHPDDRAEVARLVTQAVETGGGFDFALRIVRADGEVRHVACRGLCERGPGDEPTAIFGTVMDVTELRQAERGAAEKSAALAATLDTMDQGLIMVGSSGRIEVCNSRALDLLDLPADMMTSRPTVQEVLDLQWAAGEFDGADDDVRALMRAGGLAASAHVYERTRPNGTMLEIRTVPLADGGAVRTYTDVTARRRAERDVVESEARFRLLADHATDMIVRADADTRRRYVSPAARELLGYEPDELLGTRPLDGVHPDDRAAYADVLEALAGGGVDVTASRQRYRRKDGSFVWTEAMFRCLRDGDGAPSGYVASVRDISDRMAAEAAVRESEARYRLLADNASDLIILGHADGRRSYISPAVTPMLGYTIDEAHRIGMRDWLHPEDLPSVFATTASLTATRPTASVVYRLKHRAGHHVWVEAAFRRVEEGGDVTIITAIRDVTERKRQAERLEQAKVAAEAGARVKAEFLANMSHELRTPLTGMLGVHDLLQGDPSLTDRQRHFVGLAQESGRALLTIVNDILDFSKIEAGQMAIETVPFALRELVESCRGLGAETIKLKGVSLTAEVEAGVPDLLLGDPTRVRQVLLNLVTNAVKFTSEGEIAIRATAPAGRLRIAISDTGIGIAREAIPHLFERFSQADGSTARRFGGTGLGLAICKRLVELMDGRIGVESEPGEGSTFWFDLPLRSVEPERREERRTGTLGQAATRSWRVLLAEDNSINQEIVRTVLEGKGHAVTVVGDGGEAVRAFRAGSFDVVLMDVQMPGMDGLAATAEIRAFERAADRRPTPIVALTANAMAEEVERCRQAGMDDHVAKPIDWSGLFAAMDRACSRRGLDRRGRRAGAPAPLAILDESALEELAAVLGPDRIAGLLRSFRHEMERRLALLEAPTLTVADLGGQAHVMISLAGQLGFRELAAFCVETERAASIGGGLDRLDALRAIAERAREAAARSTYADAAAA